MKHTYYTLKCPHCNHTLKRMATNPVSYGCPFKPCPRCRRTYIDKYCYEEALNPYKPERIADVALTAALIGFFIAPFLVIACYIISDADFSFVTAFISYAIVVALVFCCRLLTLKKRNIKSFEAWSASEARLNNEEYAIALCVAGFDVPSKYLPD